MINISDGFKTTFFSDSVQRNLHIVLPDGTDIGNENIHQESLSIQETLCDQSNIQFGVCGGSSLSVTVDGIDSTITGKEVSVYLKDETNTNSISLGKFTVEKPSMSINKGYKTIRGYDRMSWLDADVSDWYADLYRQKSEWTLKELRESLLTYLNIPFENVTLVNDLVSVGNTLGINPTIVGRQILSAICELNGVFGRINRDGVFVNILLNRNEICPSETLYPSNTLFPGAILNPELNKIPEYKSCLHEEYYTAPIDSVITENDNYIVKVGVTGDNSYKVSSNFILDNFSDTQMEAIADRLLSVIGDISFMPHETSLRGMPWMEVGDYITIVDDEGVTTHTYILNRSLEGIQALSDEFRASGDEYFQDDFTSISSTTENVTARTVDKGLESYNTQSQNMFSIIAQQFGLYRVEVPQPDGSTRFYMCDHPTLTQSVNVWQMTAGGIMQSTNGGETWHVDNEGNALFNSVIAYKIKANQLDVDDIFAQNITASGTITGAKLVGGTVQGANMSNTNMIGGSIKSANYSPNAGTYINLVDGTILSMNSDGVNPATTLWIYGGNIMLGIVQDFTTLLSPSGLITGSISCDELNVVGTKSRVVKTKNYGTRKMYCLETPTPIFSDFGNAKLDGDGLCYIYLDDIFAETVDTDCTYNVSLTKYGQGELWVDDRQHDYFVVKGTPNLEFGWTLNAVQKEYEAYRLEEFTGEKQEKEPDYGELGANYYNNFEKEILNYEESN